MSGLNDKCYLKISKLLSPNLCQILIPSTMDVILVFATVQRTFAIPNGSDLAGNVLLLLLLVPKGSGPEPDEVAVQVLQKAFCRPL